MSYYMLKAMSLRRARVGSAHAAQAHSRRRQEGAAAVGAVDVRVRCRRASPPARRMRRTSHARHPRLQPCSRAAAAPCRRGDAAHQRARPEARAPRDQLCRQAGDGDERGRAPARVRCANSPRTTRRTLWSRRTWSCPASAGIRPTRRRSRSRRSYCATMSPTKAAVMATSDFAVEPHQRRLRGAVVDEGQQAAAAGVVAQPAGAAELARAHQQSRGGVGRGDVERHDVHGRVAGGGGARGQRLQPLGTTRDREHGMAALARADAPARRRSPTMLR